MQRREMARHTRRRSPTALPDEMAWVATRPLGGLLMADPCCTTRAVRITRRNPVGDCVTRRKRDLSRCAAARPDHPLYRPCQASRLSWGATWVTSTGGTYILCGSNVSRHKECEDASTCIVGYRRATCAQGYAVWMIYFGKAHLTTGRGNKPDKASTAMLQHRPRLSGVSGECGHDWPEYMDARNPVMRNRPPGNSFGMPAAATAAFVKLAADPMRGQKLCLGAC